MAGNEAPGRSYWRSIRESEQALRERGHQRPVGLLALNTEVELIWRGEPKTEGAECNVGWDSRWLGRRVCLTSLVHVIEIAPLDPQDGMSTITAELYRLRHGPLYRPSLEVARVTRPIDQVLGPDGSSDELGQILEELVYQQFDLGMVSVEPADYDYVLAELQRGASGG